MKGSRAWILLLALGACGYRPARFADRAPVLRVDDDRPIRKPRAHAFISELYEADIYVRRELVAAMDPRRPDAALDVNSHDEVPRSSWYRGTQPHRPLAGYRRDGPPRPPIVDDDREARIRGAHAVTDARGLRYELVGDPEGRRGMRTSAAAVASRLVWALGYRTPEVHVVRHHGDRWAATRWPLGADLGPTPNLGFRDDDPNDRIPHRRRRTLRALRLVAAWLQLDELRATMLRDAYHGHDGRGHVRHYLVGLGGALGVDDYMRAVRWANDPDRQNRNFFFRVVTLGLSPKPPARLPETPWPSVGLLREHLDAAEYTPGPPFEPIDHRTAADEYWIAKRIAALPEAAIAEAASASELPSGPRQAIERTLRLRRARVAAFGLDQTTPLEVASVGEQTVVIRDLGVAYGFVPIAERSYRVEAYDAQGEALVDPFEVEGARGELPLEEAMRAEDYLVLRVTAQRRGVPLARAMEIHLKPDDRPRLLGIRH